jgi:hypothetical protein
MILWRKDRMISAKMQGNTSKSVLQNYFIVERNADIIFTYLQIIVQRHLLITRIFAIFALHINTNHIYKLT